MGLCLWPPVSLLTEIGLQFTAKFFQTACVELGIAKGFTTAYHPQTNGQVERYKRTILAALRAYVANRQDDWDDYTAAVTFTCNFRVNRSLGMPPFELTLSRPPSLSTYNLGLAKRKLLRVRRSRSFWND